MAQVRTNCISSFSPVVSSLLCLYEEALWFSLTLHGHHGLVSLSNNFYLSVHVNFRCSRSKNPYQFIKRIVAPPRNSLCRTPDLVRQLDDVMQNRTGRRLWMCPIPGIMELCSGRMFVRRLGDTTSVYSQRQGQPPMSRSSWSQFICF